MAVETQTGQAKKKFGDAVREDMEVVTKALSTAREIFQALTSDAKSLDNGLVTACTGWSKHLDKMLNDVAEEVTAVEKRMGGNGRPKASESVDETHAKAVSAAREDAAAELGRS